MDKRVLLVIPAYNEEKSIKKTCDSIDLYNKKNKSKIDYIVINDGSLDNTSLVLEKNSINHIDLIANLGIGGAVQTGYKYALYNGYDIAVQFDGDGQHDINFITNLIDPILKGKANMVIGSRFVEKEKEGFKSSRARRLGIKIISFFIKLKTKTKLYDVTSGYRAIDLNLIKQFSNYYPSEYPEPISSVNALKNDYKIVEVPVVMKEREHGKSSISSWKNVYYMINVILSIILMKGKRK